MGQIQPVVMFHSTYIVLAHRGFLQKYVDLIKLPAFKNKDILHTDSNRTVILECEMAC